jgi:hypothetical protein
MAPIQFGILAGLLLLAIGFSCYAIAKIQAAIQVATQCLAGQLSLRKDVTTLSHELETLKNARSLESEWTAANRAMAEQDGTEQRKEPDDEGPR